MKTMNNLQRLRKAAGLSQSQLAEASEVSVRTIQDCEQNPHKINGMAVQSAIRLADALGVDVRELIEKSE